MTNVKNVIDINDIIFSNKNQQYGAYTLRKKYPKYAKIACFLGFLLYFIGSATPLAMERYKEWKEKNKPKVHKMKVNTADLIEAKNLPDKKEEQKIEQPMEEKPAVSTVQFLPPVVKPDALVAEEFIPTQEEMKLKDPGKMTQEGSGYGTSADLGLLEVEKPKADIVENTTTEKEQVFDYVEEMPTFPGGDEELYAFIGQNIVYPEIAKKAGTEGRVTVRFTVGKDGRVSNPEILKGIGAGCDEEALRVVKSLPRFTPGKQNGVAVPVKYIVPIVFKLTN